MKYENIMQELEGLTLFELYEISAIIEDELNNQHRLDRVKDKLKRGQLITWFQASTHDVLKARILECNEDTCSIENVDDGDLWDIPYSAINTDTRRVEKLSKQKIDTKKIPTLEEGNMIMFIDKFGNSKYGIITKLNKKTVSVFIDNVDWQVRYDLIKAGKDMNGNRVDIVYI